MQRKDEMVFVRLVHKESFFNKKTKEVEKTESWFTISFFAKKADAAEREIQVGDRLIVTGDLNVFPKEGPTSRVRLNASSFYILLPFDQQASPRKEEFDG